jgi:hypothetical protein
MVAVGSRGVEGELDLGVAGRACAKPSDVARGAHVEAQAALTPNVRAVVEVVAVGGALTSRAATDELLVALAASGSGIQASAERTSSGCG